MNKVHKLIIGHGYSLSNETDSDIMTDYFPGIWGISSFKNAINYAAKYILEGDTVHVTTYNNPKYAKKGNEAIKILGLKQELFPEPEALTASVVTNDKPANLAQLKKFLKPDMKIKVINYRSEGTAERIATVLKVLSNNMTLTKAEEKGFWQPSWLEFNKASDWTFDNEGATVHYMDSQTGEYTPSTRLEYI
jgi:hypothetical protein